MQPGMASKISIYDLNFSDFTTLLSSWGEPAYRAEQIWRGLYKQFYDSPDQFSNLPASLQHRLVEEFSTTDANGRNSFSLLYPETIQVSADGETQKTLFSTSAVNKINPSLIEAVLMRYDRRFTLCISTQVGCAMGCVFCATGQMGKTHIPLHTLLALRCTT